MMNNESLLTIKGEWCHLSPISLVYDSMKLAWAILKDYTIIVWICIALYMMFQSVLIAAIALVVMISLFAAVVSIVRLVFFKYQFTDSALLIHSGVFRRKHTNIPFDRVQHVVIEEPWVYRFAGYVCATFDTAGHKTKDGRIAAMKREDAERIKEQILAMRDMATSSDCIDVSVEQCEPTVLTQRSAMDLFIHGVCHNRILWFIGLVIVGYIKALEFAPGLSERLSGALSSMPNSNEPWFYFGISAAGLLLLLMVGFLGSGIMQIIKSYGFKLIKTERGFSAEEGLLTKKSSHVQKRRLQWVIIRQTIMDRLFRRKSIELVQMNDSIVVPGLRNKDVEPLLLHPCSGATSGRIDYKRVSMVNYLLVWLLCCGPLLWLGYVSYVQLARTGFGLFFFFCAGVIGLVSFLRWYRYGYAQDDVYLYLKVGRMDERVYCIDKTKIQSVTFSLDPIGNLLGRCHLRIGLAGKTIRVPYMLTNDALSMRDSCLQAIHKGRESWL